MAEQPDSTLAGETLGGSATLIAGSSSIASRSTLGGASKVSLERGTLDLLSERRYATLGTLGEGGMGLVKLNTDRRIGRDVAVKRLRPQLVEDPRARARFLREAKIQGQLEHPAIVPVYDLGQSEDGGLYFTMKRVKGRTLRELFEARDQDEADAPSLRRLLTAFSQICRAVAFAHSRGVIHRDLKPSNLMLGEHGEVYVLDWGVARLLAGDSLALERGDASEPLQVDAPEALTRHGAVVGTPGYMSPEQAEGKLEQLGPGADVWSLGAILFELLAGQRLIPRSGPLDMLQASCSALETNPRQLVPELAPELASLCEAALQRKCEQRLGSAGALSEGIERYLDGDRDAQMRRKRACEHAEQARAAAERAFASDDLEQRRAAGRESSMALALDPDNPQARRTLVELFTRPPRAMPPGAQRSLDESRLESLRAFYRESMLAVLSYSVILLALLFVSMQEKWEIWAALTASTAYASGCLYGLRRGGVDTYLPLVLHTIVCTSLLILTRLFSPLAVIPVLVTMNVMVTAATPGSAPRWLYGLIGTLPILGAGLLEHLGVWSPTMVWEGGEVLLSSPMLSPGADAPVLLVLLVLSALPMLISTPLNARIQQHGERINRELHLQRWQLEQLML